jgi:hypothetical protein
MARRRGRAEQRSRARPSPCPRDICGMTAPTAGTRSRSDAGQTLRHIGIACGFLNRVSQVRFLPGAPKCSNCILTGGFAGSGLSRASGRHECPGQRSPESFNPVRSFAVSWPVGEWSSVTRRLQLGARLPHVRGVPSVASPPADSCRSQGRRQRPEVAPVP